MLILEELEETTLYDAGLAVDIAAALEGDASTDIQTDNFIAEITNTEVKELVIVDFPVADRETFNMENQGIDYYLINKDETIESLTSTISSYTNLTSIHIISHGSEGQIELAGNTINSANLHNSLNFFEAIKSSLSESGDLLLYGCNIAEQSGHEFINLVSQLTDADVAASDDLTGSDALGGDWDLEVSTGDIEADSLILPEYNDLLRTIRWNVGATGGVFNGHLADGNQQWEFRGGNPAIIQLYHVGNDVLARALNEGTVTVYFFESGGRGDAQEPEQHTFIFSFPNQAPMGQDQSISAVEDLEYSFVENDFSDGFSDADRDSFAGIRINSLPDGNLFLNGNPVDIGTSINSSDIQQLDYLAPLNQFGESLTSFNFAVFDGSAYSSSYTMTIDVSGVNDAPEILSGSPADNGIAGNAETLFEDTSLVLNLNDYIYDADNDIISLIDDGSAVHGVISDNGDGTVTYTPGLNYFGSDIISLTVTDGEFNLEVSIPVIVTPVNDAPLGSDQQITVLEDSDYIFQNSDFSNNYSDIENDPFAGIRIDSLPAGTLTLNGNPVNPGDEILTTDIQNLVYRAPLDQFGTNFSGFNFAVFDGTDFSTESYDLSIDVSGVNDAPVLRPGSPADHGIAGAAETVFEDTALVLNLSDYVFDADNDPLSIGNINFVDNGSIIDNGDGTVTYTPDLNYFGSDTVNISITDGELSTDVEIPLNILAVNDAPVSNNDIAVTEFNTAVKIDVLANDYDVEGDVLYISRIISSPDGTAVTDGNYINFTPVLNFTGIATVIYEVSDGQDISNATLTVEVKAPLDFVDTSWEFTEFHSLSGNKVFEDDSIIKSPHDQTGFTDGEYSVTAVDNKFNFLNLNKNIFEISDGEYSVPSLDELHLTFTDFPNLKQFQSPLNRLISKL